MNWRLVQGVPCCCPMMAGIGPNPRKPECRIRKWMNRWKILCPNINFIWPTFTLKPRRITENFNICWWGISAEGFCFLLLLPLLFLFPPSVLRSQTTGDKPRLSKVWLTVCAGSVSHACVSPLSALPESEDLALTNWVLGRAERSSRRGD